MSSTAVALPASSKNSSSTTSCSTFLPPIYYKKSDYIQTASGNKVCRNSVLCGSQYIQLAGRSIVKGGVILRGDMGQLRIGKYVIIGENSVLRPSTIHQARKTTFLPLSIHDYVYIGDNCIIQAAVIGSYVHVGENSVIGKRCVLKNYCKILPNTVLPSDTVVPSFCVFGGIPGRYVEDLPESAQFFLKQNAENYYKRFSPILE